jgi:hypothetical protein
MSAKLAIKQVDGLLGKAGVVPDSLFGSWVREAVGARGEIVVAMNRTNFDADNLSTLALHLFANHETGTPRDGRFRKSSPRPLAPRAVDLLSTKPLDSRTAAISAAT